MGAVSTTSRWLVAIKPNPRARLRLFLFPYAGGGAHTYREWGDALPPYVEAFALQYPGRGARILEPAFTRLSPLVEKITDELLPYMDKPYTFFGHSMGALVGFEVARKLRREHGLAPGYLFVSGCNSPQDRQNESRYSLLPENELIDELTRFDGAPKEVLENRELMNLMLPTIRADFAVCEDYSYASDSLLSCPIIAVGGIDDHETSRTRLELWRNETDSYFELKMFEGGHFFINSAHKPLLQFVTRQLERTAWSLSSTRQSFKEGLPA